LAAGTNDDVSIPLITGWGLAGVALATSIDAAAAGVTIAFLQQPVLVTCAIIGIVTFLLSSAGVLLGGALGPVVGKRAEMLGGFVLIGLGCKILMEHQFLSGG
jgi:manganese efflux pump family protein